MLNAIAIMRGEVASTEPDIDEVNPVRVNYREGAGASLGARTRMPMGVAELDLLPNSS